MPILKGICDMCSGSLNEISRKKVGDTLYVILKCIKCNHVVARNTIE